MSNMVKFLNRGRGSINGIDCDPYTEIVHKLSLASSSVLAAGSKLQVAESMLGLVGASELDILECADMQQELTDIHCRVTYLIQTLLRREIL